MTLSKPISYLIAKRFALLAWILIILGISYRVTLFFQNRNLIIDEANVVRNVYERNLLGLLKPLDYEQYAPPLYLWQLEISSWLFGYSEFAMRLPALIWGIGSLFVFYALNRKLMEGKAAWLALGLLSGAPPIIKYAAEVKQYGPDLCIALILTYAALKADIFSWSRRRFFLFWGICGSIAIWASQPSVFVLACIGGYYFAQSVAQKKWSNWKLLAPIATIWFVQFAVYFKLILEPQINSDYLQSYHRDFFLFALPKNSEEWQHNWMRLCEIINNTVGYSQRSVYLSYLFLPLGAIMLFRQSFPRFLLICGPVLLTLLAAALHQFSLIERVALFILPFMMLTVGLGFATLLRSEIVVFRLLVILIGLNMLWEFNYRQVFREKQLFQEITMGLDLLKEQQVPGNELYIDCATKDAFIYYLEIHPKRNRYLSLKDAHLIPWSENDFVALGKNIPGNRAFFLFTGGGEEHRNEVIKGISASITPYQNFDLKYCFLTEFRKNTQ